MYKYDSNTYVYSLYYNNTMGRLCISSHPQSCVRLCSKLRVNIKLYYSEAKGVLFVPSFESFQTNDSRTSQVSAHYL